VPFFQTIPIFGLLFGYFFLHETVTAQQLVGILLVIVGNLGITVVIGASRLKFNWNVCIAMVSSSFLLAMVSLLYKFFALQDSYFVSNFWLAGGAWVLAIGIVITMPRSRRQFLDVFRFAPRRVVGINIINEIIALFAGLLVNYAFLLAPIALVMSVNALQPVFVFLMGLGLSIWLPHLIEEKINAKIILQRIACIVVVAIGAALLA
jgi:drug/metabolite transporter (DMT)-like permease